MFCVYIYLCEGHPINSYFLSQQCSYPVQHPTNSTLFPSQTESIFLAFDDSLNILGLFSICFSSDSHAQTRKNILINLTLTELCIHAATSNIWDISFRTGHNTRHFTYISLTCFLPAETWTWSKVPLQCFEGILCLWQRRGICSGMILKAPLVYELLCLWSWMILVWNAGNGFFSWSVASLYEWRGCFLAIGCIT